LLSSHFNLAEPMRQTVELFSSDHGFLGCAVLPRRRPMAGRIPDMFDGQKRAARKAEGKMRALLGF
jgi:hypothetical protein